MNKWTRIALFYLIAISSSLPLKLFPPSWYSNIDASPFIYTSKALLIGLGPFIGAMLLYRLIPDKKRMTFDGGQTARSLLMLLPLLLLFAIFGLPNDFEINKHLWGFWIACTVLLYAFLEEWGWRGYLEDELRDNSPILKYVLIGTLWYAWHFSFLNTDLMSTLVTLGVFILVSWGIGQIALTTYSIIACACFHTIGNVMSFYPVISDHMAQNTRLAILAGCVAAWIYLSNQWKKEMGGV